MREGCGVRRRPPPGVEDGLAVPAAPAAAAIPAAELALPGGRPEDQDTAARLRLEPAQKEERVAAAVPVEVREQLEGRRAAREPKLGGRGGGGGEVQEGRIGRGRAVAEKLELAPVWECEGVVRRRSEGWDTVW
jgi:hypothetical protein